MQRGIRTLGRGAFAVAMVTVCVIGITSTPRQAEARGPKVCPLIYAPVICDNGKVYTNQCYADKAHATGCVPYGDPI